MVETNLFFHLYQRVTIDSRFTMLWWGRWFESNRAYQKTALLGDLEEPTERSALFYVCPALRVSRMRHQLDRGDHVAADHR